MLMDAASEPIKKKKTCYLQSLLPPINKSAKLLVPFWLTAASLPFHNLHKFFVRIISVQSSASQLILMNLLFF
jgi:hypothetical protein